MANELNVSIVFNFAKSNAAIARSSGGVAITVAGAGAQFASQVVPTSDTAIELGGIALGGYILLHNQDVANLIEVGLTGAYCIKLLAGEWAVLRWMGATLYAKATTASVALEYCVLPA